MLIKEKNMKNLKKMGFAVEVYYKDATISTKYFGINQYNKANNYFNKMNNTANKDVHKVKAKITQVLY